MITTLSLFEPVLPDVPPDEDVEEEVEALADVEDVDEEVEEVEALADVEELVDVEVELVEDEEDDEEEPPLPALEPTILASQQVVYGAAPVLNTQYHWNV